MLCLIAWESAEYCHGFPMLQFHLCITQACLSLLHRWARPYNTDSILRGEMISIYHHARFQCSTEDQARASWTVGDHSVNWAIFSAPEVIFSLKTKHIYISRYGWLLSVISDLGGRLRKDCHEFKDRLAKCYIESQVSLGFMKLGLKIK